MDFIICPICQGRGYKNSHICPECKGQGVFSWYGGYLISFRRDFSSSSIFKYRLRVFRNFILTILLFLFGLFGLYNFATILVAYFKEIGFAVNLPLLSHLFFLEKRASLIFLISVLTDLYLFYSYSLFKQEQVKNFPKSSLPRSYLPVNWSEIKLIKKKYRINVFDALSNDSLKILNSSWLIASKEKASSVEPVHLLRALLEDKDCQEALVRLEISPEDIKEQIKEKISKGEQKQSRNNLYFSSDFKKVLLRSYVLAGEKSRHFISPLDIFESLVLDSPEIKDIFFDLGVEEEDIKNVGIWFDIRKGITKQMVRFAELARYKPKRGIDRAYLAIATPTINTYCQDLTDIGRRGYLPLCLDREKEIDEIFRVLKSGQNGVVLVGNPGVGKTTIINGIARRMVVEDVPPFLQDKRLVSLNLSYLISGATQRGELEQRLNLIISEAVRSGNIVFFIRDIHNMVGVKGMGGELDISEILADAIKKKLVYVLSTSIPQEYYRLIERTALGEVLSMVSIAPPNDEVNLQILGLNANRIEAKEGVYFSYKALKATLEFSKRYIHERFLPEKAINLLKECAILVRNQKGKNSFVKEEDVAFLVSSKTNIPLTSITQTESKKLLNLEKEIHKRIINQEEAVKLVASALRRARVELRDTRRPIANLLFLGPTGVGKTELAKTVSYVYFGSEKQMVRIDMSEYQTKESIDRLIGSPDGSSAGYLTEAVRKNPYTLLLLDEIEKAHPDILNLFLQVMDDGRLTDSLGRTVDFTNVILIGTSNAGTSFIQEEIKKNTPLEKIRQDLIQEKLQDYFKPEFLNRFDSIVVFKPLTKENIKEIARLMLNKLARQVEEKGIILKFTEEAISELAQKGFDPLFGARPLRRVIQEEVNDALARFLLENKISRGDIAILEKGCKIRIQKD